MKGSYRIIVSNAKLRYDFVIKRNITILRGDSATGKTTLLEMISEYYEAGESSGIELRSECPCRVLGGKDWRIILDSIEESIVFIEEDNAFLSTNEFSERVRASSNYYVIVTRDALPNLPYSVEEIYGIRESGKYASLKQTYNEFYHIYGRTDYTKSVRPELVITEDSNAGYEFFHGLSHEKDYEVISAEGKSNIYGKILALADENILIIADGAAFGPEMDRVMKLLVRRKGLVLYLPESFEWLILGSGLVEDTRIKDIMEQPENYIESSLYFSWERYFTRLLVDLTENTYLQYSKRRLNEVYLHQDTALKITGLIQDIQL